MTTDLVPYKSTPTFTEETIPAGLRRDHRTRPGVYGRIVVEDGTLLLTMDGRSETLRAGDVAIAPPEAPHAVEPVGSVRFHVEFCREAP